jgi:hypothetical protein
MGSTATTEMADQKMVRICDVLMMNCRGVVTLRNKQVIENIDKRSDSS